MSYRSEYYSSSLAVKPNDDIYETNATLKAVKTKREAHRKTHLLVILAIIAVALFGFTVYRASMVTDLNYGIERERSRLSELQNKNSLLQVDIEKSLNLNAIRKEACEKYGMRVPSEKQKVYVKIKKQDISVVCDES